MLANKEFVAIFLLISAVLCILNAAWAGNVNPSSGRWDQVVQKIVSVGTAYICILYALSTWFYHSNYFEPRQHIRIVFLIMLCVLILANLTVFGMLLVELITWSMTDVINPKDMFSPYASVCNIISIVLVIITVVLLLIVFIYLLCHTISKQREHKQRQTTD